MNAYLAQLEKPFRKAARPLARDPVFLGCFEQAQGALAIYFRSADVDESHAYAVAINSCVQAVLAARQAAPVLAELQGEQLFARQIFAFVLYRVVEAAGATELARTLYKKNAPRAIAGRVDLRVLREALSMSHPVGATPGHEIVDEQLRKRIEAAASHVAKITGDRITMPRIAREIGVNEKTLRTWIQDSNLGRARDIMRGLRERHGQRVKRPKSR